MSFQTSEFHSPRGHLQTEFNVTVMLSSDPLPLGLLLINVRLCSSSAAGVKQGCILSPLLFALYIDDLIQELNAKETGVIYGDGMLSTLLYADDIVLIAPNELTLQSMIMIVEKWCKTWQMSLNVDKTNIVHFR